MPEEPDIANYSSSSSSFSCSEDEDEFPNTSSVGGVASENNPSLCSICKAPDRPTQNIENRKELKSIIQHIESSSLTVRKVKFACQTCLYKFYTVIDQNRIKTAKVIRELASGVTTHVTLEALSNLPCSSASVTADLTDAAEEVDESNASDYDADDDDDDDDDSEDGDDVLEPSNCTLENEEYEDISIDESDNEEEEEAVQQDIITQEEIVQEEEEVQEEVVQEDVVQEDVIQEEVLLEEVVQEDVVQEEVAPEEMPQTDVGEEEVDQYEEQEPVQEEQEHLPESQPQLEELLQLDNQQEPSPGVASSASSSQSRLDVMFERSESALITESGGTLEQYKNPPLECRYCPKVFILKKPYQRHMRSHESKALSIRSASTSRGRITPSIVYACTDCSATFDRSAKLKSHCRIHMKRYYCTYCHKENLSLLDHEFHEAECKGEQMAREEFPQARRVTRSVSRSLRSMRVTADSEDKLSSTTGRRSQTNNDEDDDDEEDHRGNDGYAESLPHTDYEEDHRNLQRWVGGTCNSEYGNTSLISQRIDPNALIVSKKEYDVIMLKKLITQARRNVFTCFFPNCGHITNTLREMSLHEVLIHKYKTYFYCRKCKGVFTTKLFYDFHVHVQNYGNYCCHKCGMRFNYEYELQLHLVKHQETESFPCRYCGNSYMSSQELRIHCLETGHDPKKRKATITIDHSLTIENEKAPEPPPPKREYKCTINIMNLPKPDKRLYHEIWDKGKRMFLGEIDYKYGLGLNCVLTE